MQTFGDSSGPLFDSVENMSQLTDTLAANDQFVDGFMSDLTSVSSQLAADRGNLAKALAALARAVGTVRTFVHDNKGMVETDVRELTRLLGVTGPPQGRPEHTGPDRCARPGQPHHRPSTTSRSRSGSRMQTSSNGANLGNMLCDIIYNSGKFPGACRLQHLPAAEDDHRAVLRRRSAPTRRRTTAQPAQLKLGGSAPVTSLTGLLNALKAGNKS